MNNIYNYMTTLKYKIAFILMLFLASCADAIPYSFANDIEPVGFWYGLWHGFIAPFSFIISLFDERVAMYAIYNRGGLYDFGFLLGVITWGLGGQRNQTPTGQYREFSSSLSDKEVDKKYIV